MRVFITLLFFFVFTSTFSQTIQPCVVMEYNERLKKTPLGNVVLRVKNASTTLSNGNGECTLRFRTLKPGDRVEYVQGNITREGYEVFNKEALEQWTLSGGQRPFRIDMVKSTRFKKIRDSYEAAMSKNYREQREREQTKLKKECEANHITNEEYKRRLQEVQDEYDQHLEDIAEQVDRFARIDLSELSETDVKALEMLQQGNIEEAIRIKESQDILAMRAKLVAEMAEIERQELIEELVRRDQRIHILDSLRSTMLVSARTQLNMYLAMGTAEYRAKADSFYYALAVQDTTDIKMLQEYFSYARVRNNVDGLLSIGNILVDYYYKEYLQMPYEYSDHYNVSVFLFFQDALDYLKEHNLPRKHLTYDSESDLFEISVFSTKRDKASDFLSCTQILYQKLNELGESETGFRYMLKMKEAFEQDQTLRVYDKYKENPLYSPASYYAQLCQDFAKIRQEQEEYKEALLYAKEACATYEQFPRGTFDDPYYYARNLVQRIYKTQNDYQGCMNFYNREVEASKKDLDTLFPIRVELEKLLKDKTYPSMFKGLEDLYKKDKNYREDFPGFKSFNGFYLQENPWMQKHYERREKFNSLFKATYRYGDALYNMMQTATVFGHLDDAILWGVKATDVFENLAKLNDDRQPQLGNMHWELAWRYSSIGNRIKSLEYAKKGLAFYETREGKKIMPHNNRPYRLRSLIKSYSVVGDTIVDLQFFLDRIERLKIHDSQTATDVDWYALGDAYYDLFDLYQTIGTVDEALKQGEEAARCYMNMSGSVAPSANMFRELQQLCINDARMELAIKYGNESLKFYQNMGKYGVENENIGIVTGHIHYFNAFAHYFSDKNYEEICRELDNSIEIYETRLEKEHYDPWIVEVQGYLMRSLDMKFRVCDELKQYDECLKIISRQRELLPTVIDQYGGIFEIDNNEAYVYAYQGIYDKAYESINRALIEEPVNPNFYDTKGEILLMQGRNDEALAMWKKVLELNPGFLKDYPDGTNLSNGLRKLGLIE